MIIKGIKVVFYHFICAVEIKSEKLNETKNYKISEYTDSNEDDYTDHEVRFASVEDVMR